MEGASQLVGGFDDANLDGPDSTGTVFAGGGRGLKVVAYDQAKLVITALQDRYRAATCGGQLAVAQVPLDIADQAASLRWLRLHLNSAKDTAPAPTRVPLPTKAAEKCTDCRIRKITTEYTGAEGQAIPTCQRCADVVKAGREGVKKREGAKKRWTLEDISTKGVVAVVSADGNNLGALFAGLRSLEDSAICSDLVRDIFKQAHIAACPSDGRFVASVVGGDDFRVFLAPEHLIKYVTTLARQVEGLSNDLASRDLPAPICDALSGLGVGVGAIIAPFHFPASRLIEMAHELEDSAKVACLANGDRSAFDFIWLKSGQEMSQGLASFETNGRPPPLSLSAGVVDEYVNRARAIREVPTSQRAMMVGARAQTDELEFMNLFRYQVARSPLWQQWFVDCNVNWRDPVALGSNLPDGRLLDVAALTEMGQ
jgi:hypothetical protein